MTYRDWIHRTVGLGLTAFAVWNATNPLNPMVERSLFIGLLVLMVFLKDWANPRRSTRAHALDLVGLLATLAVFGYIIGNSTQIDVMVVDIPPEGMVLGFLGLALLLEATRRGMGWSLTILVAAFIVYIFFGEHLPAWLGGHVGFSTRRILINMYLSTNGMFGIIAHVMLKYVFMFFLFGQILEWTKALNFIMKFALALVGRFRGGPAMVATVSSGLMGTVSGSAVANVMVTGTVTIPLMKRTGFKPWVAGGIEAAASSGGQFMPPVMGATAFLIAQFLGIEYFEVIKAAFIPAVLYYLGVLTAVYVYAVRSDLKGLPPEELPTWREVFAGSEGFTFLGGFIVLVGLLLMRYSAPYAVTYSMLAILVIDIVIKLVKRQRFDVVDFVRAAADAPRGFAGLGAATASVGIVVAAILLTGLAGRLSTVILGIAGANLIPILILTMIAALILGAGLPTSIIYILLSLVLAPALIKIGVTPLAAHLFIFYGGLMSMVTPPVAMAAYAGAAIAGTDFWRTGVSAFTFSLSAYILPFYFTLDPALLMKGTPGEIAFAAASGAFGVTLLSVALVGPPKDRLEYGERTLLAVAAVALLLPISGSTPLAVVLAALGLFRPIRRYLAQRQARQNKAA